MSDVMTRIGSVQVLEAEELLQEVRSWSEEEIDQLPKLYRQKARELRELANRGEA